MQYIKLLIALCVLVLNAGIASVYSSSQSFYLDNSLSRAEEDDYDDEEGNEDEQENEEIEENA